MIDSTFVSPSQTSPCLNTAWAKAFRCRKESKDPQVMGFLLSTGADVKPIRPEPSCDTRQS
jgi:hypothetical protein